MQQQGQYTAPPVVPYYYNVTDYYMGQYPGSSYPIPPLPPPPGQGKWPYHQPNYFIPQHRGGRGGARGGRGFNRGGGPSRRQPSQLISCKNCNREYKSQETYDNHIQSHIKCEQCDFTALPKLVRDHSVIHSLPDFLKFTSPEDTVKWRNERRKNYPTIANVTKKKLQETKRQDRREVLDTPLYRYVNKLIGESEYRGKGHGRGFNGRGRGRGRWHVRYGTRQPTENKEQSEENDSNKKRFVALEDNSQNKAKKKKWSKTNNATSRKPTLLEKLLSNEIRHEHNKLLQCVHYIVSVNFFEDNTACGDHMNDCDKID